MNTEITFEYFKYQNPSYLLKDLHNSSGIINEKTVNHFNNMLIDLRNTINRKEIPENKNLCKLDIKSHTKTINLKYQLQHGMKN